MQVMCWLHSIPNRPGVVVLSPLNTEPTLCSMWATPRTDFCFWLAPLRRPEEGVACKPYPTQQMVGGESAVLFDSSYPTGVHAA